MQFAHLLEDSSGAGAGGSNDMNMKGVNLKQQQWELSRMGNFSKGEKSWRRRNRGKGAGESGERREKKSVGRSGRKSTQRTRNFRRKQGKRNTR